MNLYKFSTLFILGLIGMTGCATSNSKPDLTSTVAQDSIPSSSPFSKLRIGMSQNQIHSLIGPPTDRKSYQISKLYIPFFPPKDNERLDEFYKGMGKITYTGLVVGGIKLKVNAISYDPNEDGYQ